MPRSSTRASSAPAGSTRSRPSSPAASRRRAHSRTRPRSSSSDAIASGALGDPARGPRHAVLEQPGQDLPVVEELRGDLARGPAMLDVVAVDPLYPFDRLLQAREAQEPAARRQVALESRRLRERGPAVREVVGGAIAEP